jgi:hypothetical protein
VNRRRFLVGLAALDGAAGLAGSIGRPRTSSSSAPPSTAAALPATTMTATTTTTTTATRVTRTSAKPRPTAAHRPMPGAEPFPAANYPPATTVTLSGVQTTQYRPHTSDRIHDLTGASWLQSPTLAAIRWPFDINDAGSSTPDGHNTVVLGGTILGNLDKNLFRGDNTTITTVVLRTWSTPSTATASVTASGSTT